MNLNINEKQVIIYGAPGTGKSYAIQESLNNNKFNLDKNIIRVVFFHDFTYSDFIGYISPDSKTGDEIDYLFTPGPFTIALEKAFESDENICLLIEELNRGNCSAIFGDTFQLLDRNSEDYSQYPISNSTIREYLNKNLKTKEILESAHIGSDDIILPPNFFIVSTMNTADQNVFTIDSAFKRRFKMKYMPIEFDLSNNKLKKLNALSSINVFNGNITWSNFAQNINQIIDNVNKDMLSISEDKKLGPFFVDEVDVSCRQTFCDKVIYYLKNDVFKYSPKYFLNSYEIIYEKFVLKNEDIFSIIGKETP